MQKTPYLIDSHAHLNLPDFDKDRESLIDQALAAGIWIINVGTDFESSRKAVEIAQNHTLGIYATIGIHPIYLEQEDYSEECLRELFSNNEKIVAVGEIGLDYYHLENSQGKLNKTKSITQAKERQKQLLLKQLSLARELNLPVIFHCRCFKNYDAHRDLLKILEKFSNLHGEYILRGVLHCYSGNYALAKIYQKLGLYFGITGVVTFSNDYNIAIRNIPSDRILVETDCPYLSPEPKRGQRNIPLFVKYTAMQVAKLKEREPKVFFQQTVRNTQELFQLNKY